LAWGQCTLKTILSKFFSATAKIWPGKRKTSNLPKIIEDRRQLEARNFETTQRIEKQITDISSWINALQNRIKLGAITPRGFDAT